MLSVFSIPAVVKLPGFYYLCLREIHDIFLSFVKKITDMKNLFSFLLIYVFCLMAIISCNSSSPNPIQGCWVKIGEVMCISDSIRYTSGTKVAVFGYEMRGDSIYMSNGRKFRYIITGEAIKLFDNIDTLEMLKAEKAQWKHN